MGRMLLKVLLFCVLFPIVVALPPVGFAVFCFFAYTLYFYRKDEPRYASHGCVDRQKRT